MKESKPLYGVWDGEDFTAIVWETELGKIVTCEGKLNVNNNLTCLSKNSPISISG